MTATHTYLGLRAFVDELVRCGVRDACTSPGSRSTPLVLSLLDAPGLRCHSHLDERSAAFFALGLAKASGRPAVLACTSGTAAANYFPAVVEAHEARVPLVVLTADRPPELRGNGAGQAIDQVKLYGSQARWLGAVDDAPLDPARLRWLRQLACRAAWTALGGPDGPAGPVHLNVSLREPLVLEAPLAGTDAVPGRPDGAPWVRRPRPAPAAAAPEELDGLAAALAAEPRAVVVAGRHERGDPLPERLVAFAERLGLPLLAEPLAQARRGAAAVAHYDALLRDPAVAAALAPRLVLRVGDLPTSGPLRRWLAGLDAAQVAVHAEGAWQDPAATLATLIAADPVTVLDAVAARVAARTDVGWLERWRRADAAAGAAIDATRPGDGRLDEPRIAEAVAAELPATACLVVAASMPVRDLEAFARVRPDPPRALANRGANGIDGTLSTALGAAAAGEDAVVLLGDLAFLHDVGALAGARRHGASLLAVVVDNDGGGIFDFLPVADAHPGYEAHVATPHGLDLVGVARGLGADATAVADLPGLRAALRADRGAPGVSVVVVRTDRRENRERHAEIWARVAEAARAVIGP